MSNIDLERVRRTGTFSGIPSWGEGVKPGGSEGLPMALSVFNMIEGARDSLTAGLLDIDKDPRLTPVGKQEAKTALGKVQAKKATEIRQAIAQLKRGRDSKAAHAAVRDPFDGDTTAAAIWTAMVAGLLPDDALRVKMAYEEALERGDLRTVVAIEQLPHLHPGRPDDVVMSELRAERVRADDPPAARALAEQDRAIQDLEALTDELAGEVRKLTGTGTVVKLSDGRVIDDQGRKLDPDTYTPRKDDQAEEDASVA